MATITVRNLDDDVQRRLKRRAADHGRSMEAEVLSEPLEARPDERVLNWLGSLPEVFGVTSVSVGELLTGIRALPPGRCRDDLIAAICASRNTTFATRSTADFAGLNLELIDPWAAPH